MLKIPFNEMNVFQKANWLADQFGEAICTVSYRPYWDMSGDEQDEAKQRFFMYLDRENVMITEDVLEHIADMVYLAEAVREYIQRNSVINSIAKKILPFVESKVTIVKFSEFGFPVAIQTVLKSVENKSYAQYDEALWIVHKPKRKRSEHRNIVLPHESLLVYIGWIDINMKNIAYSQINDITRQSKYR